MKNIYICGIPRSGKTTLAKMIKDKYPIYNQLSFEAIRNGFIKSQPELKMDNRNSDARKNILPQYIVEMAKWNNEITGNPSLIEGDFCSVDELKKILDDNSLIICLGLGGIELDKFLENIIKYDKENDYTKKWSVEKIKMHFYDQEEKDLFNKKICEENNIDYYNTFVNREDVFKTIIEKIN